MPVEQALRTTQAWDWRPPPAVVLSAANASAVLARALAVQAQVLMDEPLANLRTRTRPTGCTPCARWSMRGTVVSVLHEVSLALQSDDMVVMARVAFCTRAPAMRPIPTPRWKRRLTTASTCGIWTACGWRCHPCGARKPMK